MTNRMRRPSCLWHVVEPSSRNLTHHHPERKTPAQTMVSFSSSSFCECCLSGHTADASAIINIINFHQNHHRHHHHHRHHPHPHPHPHHHHHHHHHDRRIIIIVIIIVSTVDLTLYVCMYLCLCNHVSMYLCMYGWMDGWMDACAQVCLYVTMYINMFCVSVFVSRCSLPQIPKTHSLRSTSRFSKQCCSPEPSQCVTVD